MGRLAALFVAAVCAYGQLTAEQKKLNLDSFEKVWTTVRDKHWQKQPGGLDWQAIHDEFRPKIEKAESTEAARQVMRDMLGRLHQTHFGIIPMSVYNETDGDDDKGEKGEGQPGFDLRVLANHAIVTRVDAGSPAEAAGIKPGWQIIRVDGKDLDPVIQKLKSEPDLIELLLERAVMSKLTGKIGSKLPVTLRDGANKDRTLELTLSAPRGQASKFGNLPVEHVWVDTKKIGNTGYITFNMFLDLPRVMGRFADEVGSCLSCDGLIIDLRGNPGGIGGMAMGMAGFLIDKPDQKLGDMFMREASLHFVVNPRMPQFNGPVAVLVDGSSASTSEIFAGGLKDLGRAKIFGERTAAAALPSLIEKLPNGDGFQYAIANYISEGGKPLEGNGVTQDVPVKLTREALLAGHDPVVDAAMDWIKQQSSDKKQRTQK